MWPWSYPHIQPSLTGSVNWKWSPMDTMVSNCSLYLYSQHTQQSLLLHIWCCILKRLLWYFSLPPELCLMSGTDGGFEVDGPSKEQLVGVDGQKNTAYTNWLKEGRESSWAIFLAPFLSSSVLSVPLTDYICVGYRAGCCLHWLLAKYLK